GCLALLLYCSAPPTSGTEGRMRMCRFLIGLLLAAVPAAAGEGADWRCRIVFTAVQRLRGECVDWFRRSSVPRRMYRLLFTCRRSGLTATGGRFEYADGLETEPADPTLAFVKRFRIAERLVGPFSYSHVSRSFDGGRVSYDRPAWNVTAMAVRPTHGGFEVSANREIGAVGLAGLALTLKRLPHAPPADVRVFY